MVLRRDESQTMTTPTFKMIRTYTCRATQGFVYEINGKRAASLAKSERELKVSLGVVVERSMEIVEAFMSLDDAAAQAACSTKEMADWLRQIAYIPSRVKVAGVREVRRPMICRARQRAIGMLVDVVVIDADGGEWRAPGVDEKNMGFKWVA